MIQKHPVSVVIAVNARPALPIRALPYVTNWVLHPFPLAMLLCGMAPPGWESFKLAVYQLMDGRSTYRPSTTAWPDVLITIRQEMHDSNAAEPDDEKLRERLVRLLPPGTFVWKDEFEGAYRRFFDMLDA